MMPDTNARGWPLWVLFNPKTKEVMRHEYKSDEEAADDNKQLSKGSLGWKWILNDSSRA